MNFFKHERTLQKIRNHAFPTNPKDCAEIIAAFENQNIMDSIGRSQHVSKYAFFNGAVKTEEHSFCVFSSKHIMDLIEKRIESGRREYMLDATFKVVPIGPFNQLLIFHIKYIQKVRLHTTYLFYFGFKPEQFIFILHGYFILRNRLFHSYSS